MESPELKVSSSQSISAFSNLYLSLLSAKESDSRNRVLNVFTGVYFYPVETRKQVLGFIKWNA